MQIRLCDPKKDLDAARRIWSQIGWISDSNDDSRDMLIQRGRGWVMDLEGEAESLVITFPGSLRYLQDELSICAVTDVATSRIGRRQGMAARLTARAISDNAADGVMLCVLRIFEQGFYNKLGFGTGPYDHFVSFDPTQLKIDRKARIPSRISADDWRIIHQSRLARMRSHGSIIIHPPEYTQYNVRHSTNGFGLGYFDGPKGELSHHLWCSIEDSRHGPYDIKWLAFQTYDQMIELLALLKNLGDQIHIMKVPEPPGMQLQDILLLPFKHSRITKKTPYQTIITALAYSQIRILDLESCINHTHLRSEPIDFNLELEDPIVDYLDKDASWRGIGGSYCIHLGEDSSLTHSIDPSLPTLKSSVGAFTRLWLGALPATTLAVTDQLAGPSELLDRLNWTFRLPEPKFDWSI